MSQLLKSLEQKVQEQQEILAEVQQLIKDRDFYKRILIQAVLTGEGKLDIDPSKAEEAFALLNKAALEFGNGKVCFHQERYSLFQE